MGNMSINSDDLKYGIECCIKYMACSPAEECCDLCPYHGRCSSLEKDALALIQQLEADLKQEKADHQHTYECAEVFQKENAELLEKIKQLERERDAAVADLATIHKCEPCKHRTSNSYTSNECFGCVNFCNFEWRGPCEENGG